MIVTLKSLSGGINRFSYTATQKGKKQNYLVNLLNYKNINYYVKICQAKLPF
jgi:hypothetical protein